MLQHVVDYNEVSKEDKEFIDMTHRNTELLEENQQLKADYGNKAQVERDLLLEEKQELINYLKNEDIDLKENVVNLEEKLRNTSHDSFYYNSYLKTLHRFRAKRELIKDILSKIEKSDN